MRVTTTLCDIVANLLENGYQGTAELTRAYPSGAASILGDVAAIKLDGFCKESMYLTHDEEADEILIVGRYEVETRINPDDANIEFFVNLAWAYYKRYKTAGYSRPQEWEDLFKEYGKITTKQVTKTVIQEAD